jgi:ribonuclease PH
MKRSDARNKEELRPIKITRHFIKNAEGSVLIQMGETRVVCTASVEDKVPQWLKDSGKGWITAEYGMLPRSTNIRNPRERSHTSGRTYEIQRLVGRALRSVINLSQLGERTLTIDCDVLQADGGTRVASINGGIIALYDALKLLKEDGKLKVFPAKELVAAVSLGMVEGEMMLDLNYEEDVQAEVDFNLVMTESGKIVEIQGTAEKEPFSITELNQMLQLGEAGIKTIFEFQRQALAEE